MFLTSRARQVFTKLKQVFIRALILNHFHLERYIRIQMDASGYAIGGIYSQLILDDLGQWYPIPFFSRKIISTKTR